MCRLPEEFVLRWGLQSWGHLTTVPIHHRRQKATVWLPQKHPFLLHGLSVGSALGAPGVPRAREGGEGSGEASEARLWRPPGPCYGALVLSREVGFEPWRQGQLCGLPGSFGQLWGGGGGKWVRAAVIHL